MRRFLHIFLALAIILSLVGCVTEPTPTAKPTTEPPVVTPTETEPAEPTETEKTEPAKTAQTNDATLPAEWIKYFKNRPQYELGINQELREKVKVHVFFVDDDVSSWDADSISEYMAKQIKPGLDFLDAQASRYGIRFSYKTVKYATALDEGYTLKYDGVADNNSKNEEINDNLMNVIARQLGYKNQEDMHAALSMENPDGEVIFMAVLNKEGVSYASIQPTGSPGGIANFEYCVVFTTFLGKDFTVDDNTHMAASVAHEILHLYGAPDLYLEAFSATAKQVCPRDIMLLDYLSIEDMDVGVYTAFSIGWMKRSPC